MGLIDKYANIYFLVTRRLIEFASLHDGITEKQIRRITDDYGVLDDNTDFVNAVIGKRNSENKFNEIQLFEYDKGTQKYRSLIKHLPVVLNHVEQRSLQEALINPHSGAFLEPVTAEKLGCRQRPLTQTTENLRQTVTAIQQGKWIVFDNTTANGTVLKNQIFKPQKIEVSALTNECFVSGYSRESERLIKCNLDRMTVHRLTDGESLDLSLYLDEKRSAEPIRLSIEDNNAATDRAFNMFSGYEKEGFFDKQTGKYILNIHYYEFEERVLIEKILSLGSAAIVVSPPNIIEIIKWRLRDQLAKLT